MQVGLKRLGKFDQKPSDEQHFLKKFNVRPDVPIRESLPPTPEQDEAQMREPIILRGPQPTRLRPAMHIGVERTYYTAPLWLFRNRLYVAGLEWYSVTPECKDQPDPEDIKRAIAGDVMRIERKEQREEERLTRWTRSLTLCAESKYVRPHIAREVRMFVWQRDKGRCVECGGRQNLEFDHIIPVADGGSSTERNLQLLCESCNNKKGRSLS